MKKIIASAVATAFVAPAFAADITISGDQEFSCRIVTVRQHLLWMVTSTSRHRLKQQTGLLYRQISTSLKIAADDGSASLTISGPFGKIDAGDTSSALDAVDDVTDWGYVLTNWHA